MAQCGSLWINVETIYILSALNSKERKHRRTNMLVLFTMSDCSSPQTCAPSMPLCC